MLERFRLLYLVWLLLPAAGLAAERSYDLRYHARFEPEAGHVTASLRVEQGEALLRVLDLNAPRPRYSDFEGDGEVRRDGDRVIWRVPAQGGRLTFRVQVDHQRDGAFDARMTGEWAVVRLDDVFPAARARTRRGAYSEATLRLEGPPGWSFATPYGDPEPRAVEVETQGRRLDRPLGWMAAGELGIRRTQIGERQLAIAGPRNEGFRRMDILTFLRWTVPELARIVPSLPSRILIVGGSQEMWRGGLSGPGSFYTHPDRPLVSGNATSTFLHELVHVATRSPPAPGDDWIVEGLAEYYSLVVLLRTGAISGARFERSLAAARKWARREAATLADPSSGADTAFAVLMFRDLALELRSAGSSLDAVAGTLLGGGEVSRQRLAELVSTELGEPSAVLARALAGLEDG